MHSPLYMHALSVVHVYMHTPLSVHVLFLGSFIKVKEQEWCFAIECCIGFGNLCGFIVDNHEDESKFKAIVREVMRRHPRAYFPPCLTSRFTVSDLFFLLFMLVCSLGETL